MDETKFHNIRRRIFVYTYVRKRGERMSVCVVNKRKVDFVLQKGIEKKVISIL